MLIVVFFFMFRFFVYFSINLALEVVLKSGFWLSLGISLSSVLDVLGTFGLRTCPFTQESFGST